MLVGKSPGMFAVHQAFIIYISQVFINFVRHDSPFLFLCMQSFQQRHQGTYSSCSPGCLRIRHYAMYPTIGHISTYHRQLGILSKNSLCKIRHFTDAYFSIGIFLFYMGNYLFHLFCRWRSGIIACMHECKP